MDFQTVWAATQHIVSGITVAEAQVLYDLSNEVHKSKVGSVVEIGAYTGKSAILLAATGFMWSIDHHRGNTEHQPGQSRCRPGTVIGGRVDTFPLFEANLVKAGLWDQVHPLIMDHLTALSAIPATALPVALLFIDAEHSYEATKSIIETWAPRVEGVILFHDYCDDFPGVVLAVNDTKAQLGVQILQVDSLIGFDRRAVASIDRTP